MTFVLERMFKHCKNVDWKGIQFGLKIVALNQRRCENNCNVRDILPLAGQRSYFLMTFQSFNQIMPEFAPKSRILYLNETDSTQFFAQHLQMLRLSRFGNTASSQDILVLKEPKFCLITGA